MSKLKIEEDGIRLDVFLHKYCFQKSSKIQIQKMLASGIISLNGQTVGFRPSHKVKYSDSIEIIMKEPEKCSNLTSVDNNDEVPRKTPENLSKQNRSVFEILPENIPLTIVFEDNDLIVVEKERGMVVHPTENQPDTFSGTLVNALLFHLKDCGKLSTVDPMRPGIIHRIDKFTSGLLVIAKNNESHLTLQEQFEEHSIQRSYITLTWNHFKDTKGTIDLPIGHSSTQNPKKQGAFTTDKNSRHPKRAVTHYSVLDEFEIIVRNKSHKMSLVECRLETGRTHQIRVHLSAIGRPVVGDILYGSRNSLEILDIDGAVLHAKELEFVHPLTKKRMTFQSSYPKYFVDLLKQLESMKMQR